MKQRTVKSPITLSGVGVHSGKICTITIEPMPQNSGIVYKKAPYSGASSSVVADYKNVSGTTMCTRISNDHGTTISVIEHLSAAFYAMGITNASVKLEEGDEIPFLDGSSLQFVKAIADVGTEEQEAEKKKIRIVREVKIGDSKRWASLAPAKHFSINIRCDYLDKGLKTEPFTYDSRTDDFVEEIAGARTFGFYSEVEYLRKNNLAVGASLDNTVVFDNAGRSLNPEGLRYPNEPVRHKVLDIIGDLSLSQYEIIGRYEAFCPGHNLNNLLLRELFMDNANFVQV